jgi:hypothetical protein
MTLKEKITDEYIWTTEPIMDAEEVSESVDKMIVIADEFAIGFADWIRVCKLKGRPYDFENIKELLEIYKDEKDL